MMNIFRLTADMLHLASIFILLLKIWTSRSVAGISFKSQVLYAIVFCTRYLDFLTFHFISLYLSVMKAIFIGSSLYVVYLMKYKFQHTWDPNTDSFPLVYVLVPCAILSLLINAEFQFMEILWAFSIYLEAVALLPQLFLLSKTGEAETITAHYVAALGGYRALYLLNWLYRYFAEHHVDWIAIMAGLVQTGLYADFLYVYVTRSLLPLLTG
jgi:ER lumen protein retaining receptor